MRVYSPSPYFIPLAEITGYTRLQIIRRFIGRSVIQIDFPVEADIVSYMQKNCWIIADDDEPFIIRTITQTEHTVTVYGFGGHSGLEGRITIPAIGMYAIEKTGSADAVVKAFIEQSTTAVNRSLNIVCPDVQVGDVISDQSRLKNLGDEVARVLIGAGRGERFRISGGVIIFDTYAGNDRSASCAFDLKYKNIKDFTYTLDATKTQSTPIVGGAGEGADREMYITGDEAAGWDRREVFIDARDVNPGDINTLTQRAAQALIGDDEQVKADVSSSANLMFGKDYFLGDIVKVNVRVKTYTMAGGFANPAVVTIPLIVRITEATETIDNGTRNVDLTFGSTFPQSDTVQTRSAVQQLQSTEGGSTDIDSNLGVIFDKMYPVGSIYLSVINTSPGALFGGTWAAFGAGKALVGLDSNDSDFDAPEKTVGGKSVTLGISEMPSHSHIQDSHNHSQNSHNHMQNSHNHVQDSHGHTNTIAVASSGDHGHSLKMASSNNTGSYSTQQVAVGKEGATVYDSSNPIGGATSSQHSHALTGGVGSATAINQSVIAMNQSATAVNQAATATNRNTGSGGAHNNIQPSIVVFMWKRTA